MTIADLPVWPGCLDEDLRGKPLTAREQEVLGLVAEGMPNRIIARHLGISENPGIAALIRKYHLHGLVAGLILLCGLYIWKNMLSFVPPHEERVLEGQ